MALAEENMHTPERCQGFHARPRAARRRPLVFPVPCVVFSRHDPGCSSMVLAEENMHTPERCQGWAPELSRVTRVRGNSGLDSRKRNPS
eukprot:2598231-Pyramimonas_sp.AAC.1